METRVKKLRRKISTEKNTVVGVVRIRLYPTVQQTILLEKISNTLRHLYNNLLEHQFRTLRRNDALKKLYKNEKNEQLLAAKCTDILNTQEPLSTPYMRQLCTDIVKESEKTKRLHVYVDQEMGKKSIAQTLTNYTGEDRAWLENLSSTLERWRDEVKITVKNAMGKYLKTGIGKPKFKKYGEFISISHQYTNPGIKQRMYTMLNLGDKKKCRKLIDIPGIGKVPAVIHRQLPGYPLRHRIIKDGHEYYLTVTFEIKNGVKHVHETLEKNENTVIGLDVGVRNTVADSRGRIIPATQKLKTLEAKYAKLQSRLDKKLNHLAETLGKEKRYIRNDEKTPAIKQLERRMQKVRKHCTRIQEYKLHKLAKKYTDRFPHVVVEDLRLKNMTASAKGTEENPGKNVRAKSGLNKSILRESPGKFFSMLEYKARNKGGELHKVDPKNTSRTCPECGCISAENRRTQSKFKCIDCGYENHADVVGAINIRARFLSENDSGLSHEENQVDRAENIDNLGEQQYAAD